MARLLRLDFDSWTVVCGWCRRNYCCCCGCSCRWCLRLLLLITRHLVMSCVLLEERQKASDWCVSVMLLFVMWRRELLSSEEEGRDTRSQCCFVPVFLSMLLSILCRKSVWGSVMWEKEEGLFREQPSGDARKVTWLLPSKDHGWSCCLCRQKQKMEKRREGEGRRRGRESIERKAQSSFVPLVYRLAFLSFLPWVSLSLVVLFPSRSLICCWFVSASTLLELLVSLVSSCLSLLSPFVYSVIKVKEGKHKTHIHIHALLRFVCELHSLLLLLLLGLTHVFRLKERNRDHVFVWETERIGRRSCVVRSISWKLKSISSLVSFHFSLLGFCLDDSVSREGKRKALSFIFSLSPIHSLQSQLFLSSLDSLIREERSWREYTQRNYIHFHKNCWQNKKKSLLGNERRSRGNFPAKSYREVCGRETRSWVRQRSKNPGREWSSKIEREEEVERE